MEKFKQQIEAMFNAKKYQDLYEFCNDKLIEISQTGQEPEGEEREIVALAYSTMAKLVDDESALELMNHAIDFVGNSVSLYLQRGKIKENLSDLSGAIEDYSIIIENAPCPEAYEARAVAHLMNKDFNAALADTTRALELAPDYANGYISRGHAKLYLEQYPEAIADYSQAIALLPDYAPAYGYRCEAKIASQDYAGALEDTRMVLKLDPENIGAKRAFLDLKMELTGQEFQAMESTKKDGTRVIQVITDEGIIELPA